MATRTLIPIFCIMFLLSASSLMLPSAEAARTLAETKAQTKTDGIIGYEPLNPGNKPNPSRGQPYARPCPNYKCRPPSEAKP